jgi:transcriptional repressor NrdR
MKCPYCNHEELKVTDSREATEMNAIRRRRECLECQRRFTTFETVELTVEVKKRDGRYEDFQQQKLINGLEAACRHTTISREQLIAIASQITGEVLQRQLREITTTELGELVMKYLQKLDAIAYIRFACVYRRFKNIKELDDAIQNINPKDEALNLIDCEK